MTESEKKDKILAFLNIESNRRSAFQLIEFPRIFEEGITNYQEMGYLIRTIADDGYIKFDGTHFNYKYETTPFIESGGYKAKEDLEILNLKHENDLKEINYTKTVYQTKLAKWQVKVFWPAFIFTVIGSIIGIISFLMQVIK